MRRVAAVELLGSGRARVGTACFRPPAMPCSAGFIAIGTSLGAPVLSWHQPPSRQVQVGQGKHRQCPGGVLVQPAVAHLGEAPQVLDHVEGMLATRPPPGAGPVDGFVPLGQHSPRPGPAVDPVANPGVPAVLPVILRPLRLVAEDLLPTQQFIPPGGVNLATHPVTKAEVATVNLMEAGGRRQH